MEEPIISLEIYDKREKRTTLVFVVPLADNRFRMVENDVFNSRLTYGAVFQTRINREGKQEIISIREDPALLTRRFLLHRPVKKELLHLFGDKIVQKGGFWQTDFGGLLTVNLPREEAAYPEEVFKLLHYYPTELKDDSGCSGVRRRHFG